MRLSKKQKAQPQWTPPTKAVTYPKWTFVKVDEEYWLILDRYKVKLISERAFWSWGKPYVLSSKEAVANYATWKMVGFAPGTLLRSMHNQFWLITGKDPLEPERRFVATPDFFNILGFNPNTAIIVSDDELHFHREGAAVGGI